MFKVILKDKGTNNMVFSKQFIDELKAERLKEVLSKYLDKNKAEIFVEKKKENKQ